MAQATNKNENTSNEEVKNAVDTAEMDNLKNELESSKAELEKSNLEKEALLKQVEELKNAVANQEKNGAYKKGSYIVHTPVKNFNGIIAGVQFAYGKANVQKGWVLDWFKEKGYEVEEVK